MSLESLVASPIFTNAVLQLQVATPFIALAGLFIALLTFFNMLSLRRRLVTLTLGKGGSIEESITVLAREMKEAQTFRGEIEQYLKLVETRLRSSISGVGVVRFNPFSGEGAGGNQSFSIALLDELGSGVVLSSLYTRDRASVYCKPVQGGASSYELTAEEKEAILNAKTTLDRRNPRAGAGK